MRTCLIAIVGGSGSGKSWLADKLQARLGRLAARLSLDDFYLDRGHLSPRRRALVNYDHPRAIDWPRCQQALVRIRAGHPVGLPLYDFATHTRRARTRLFRPKPVVLVEGLWLLRDRALRELFDCSIYLDCPIKLRLERRLARDLQKRGRNRQSVLRQFIEQVTPMHNRFVAPQSGWAELVLKSPVTSSQIMGLVKRLKRLSLGISHAGTGEARAVGELDFQATG